MDYAKLALLKAEELEKKGVAASPQIRRKGLLIEKALGAGESYTLCKINGKGAAGIVLSLDLTSFSGGQSNGQDEGQWANPPPQNAGITLLINNKAVFSRPAAATVLFTATVVLEGSATVKIKTDGDIFLSSADIMGINADIIGPAGADVKVDSLLDVCCAVYETDGQIRICSGENAPDLGEYVLAGFGTNPAIAAFLDDGQDGPVCFAVLYIDGGELVLGIFDSAKRQLRCNYTGIKAESAALIRYGTTLAAGYVYRGIAYVSQISRPDFDLGQGFKIEEALSIEFVKDALPAAVILNKRNKNVIRTAQAESVYDDAVRIRVECEGG